MSEDGLADHDPAGAGNADAAADGTAGTPTWAQIRLFLLRAAVLAGAFVVSIGLVTAGAGWYTSRSQFCRSCHIMEPYYESWQESTHSEVTCIECHFEPGVGGKVRGKLLGLIQLAKYVTASEGPRPAAEIPDASCLRSGCHDTRLLSGRVDFDGMMFDHEPHLENLRRGKQLRCTSCHSQIVQGAHMTVTKSTCFLCHFKDTRFNEGLGACTRCHQIPEQEFDLGGGIMFSHALAYEKGVNCVNCHADLIRGDGVVPQERCGVCHNRREDLEKINDAEFMHQVHVADHKVDCLNCHLEIHHSLDENLIEHAVGDCASCHPDHHRTQVAMFRGTGGRTVKGHPGGMSLSRVACRSCHRKRAVSAAGQVVWKASAEMCSACHDETGIEQLLDYETQVDGVLKEVEASITRAGAALESANLSGERVAAIMRQLEDFHHDLIFLQKGEGVHNVHYAQSLTRGVIEDLSKICRELKIDEPDIQLPTLELEGEGAEAETGDEAPVEDGDPAAAGAADPSINAGGGEEAAPKDDEVGPGNGETAAPENTDAPMPVDEAAVPEADSTTPGDSDETPTPEGDAPVPEADSTTPGDSDETPTPEGDAPAAPE